MRQWHIKLQIKLTGVGTVAQLLLEGQIVLNLILLVGTTFKPMLHTPLWSDECIGSYWTDCITANMIFDSYTLYHCKYA